MCLPDDMKTLWKGGGCCAGSLTVNKTVDI